MKPSEDIKPISYLKAHASELVRELGEHQRTLVITQNGEAKAILQDIHTYEQTQEALALMKILAQSHEDIKAGRVSSLEDTFNEVRQEIGLIDE